jgi:transcription elongation factor S-II
LLQVRSRVFNLKGNKNRELRENVLCGLILPEKIATMTAEEMASDQVN